MTDKEELALAILLWRNLRSDNHIAKEVNAALPNRLRFTECATDLAIRFAKQCGVKDEFFRLLFELPVMTIEVKELEPWTLENSGTGTTKRRSFPVARPPDTNWQTTLSAMLRRLKPSSKQPRKKYKKKSTDNSPKS